MLGYVETFSACFMASLSLKSKDILSVLLQSCRHLQNRCCGRDLAPGQPGQPQSHLYVIPQGNPATEGLYIDRVLLFKKFYNFLFLIL